MTLTDSSLMPWNVCIQRMKSFDENGHPVKFTVEVISCDRRLKKGGRVLRLVGYQVSGLRPMSKLKEHEEKIQNSIARKKDPNHFKNSTLNLYNAQTRDVRKIHLRLVTRFNDQKVIY